MSSGATNAFSEFVLASSTEQIVITSVAEARDVHLRMLEQAHRSLCLMSRRLDPRLYDDARLVEQVKQLALGSRRADIRILLQDTSSLIADGHRLIALAQHLASAINVRVVSAEHADYNAAFTLVDRSGAIFFERADRYYGSASFHAPAWAESLVHTFDEMWEQAAQDPNLRRLHI